MIASAACPPNGHARLALARTDDLRVITSAAALVEVARPRINRPAPEWTLSRLVVEPITEPIARHAAILLAPARTATSTPSTPYSPPPHWPHQAGHDPCFRS